MDPVKPWITLATSQMNPKDVYKLLIGAIVPRPIAFISTCNAQGLGNLAPFSFFNGVSSNPPAIYGRDHS
jgi:flavin reductase (DIM6/NTAB) family NADH-FMN oxidoreductase RutF